MVRDPLESMLDDKTTSTWIPRNTFGLPIRTSDDMGYWEQSFEEVYEPPAAPPPPPAVAPRFAPEQPTLRRWPVRPTQQQQQQQHIGYAPVQHPQAVLNQHFENRTRTLRAVAPAAARARTLKGHAPPPTAPAWQVAVEAEQFRSRMGVPLWFRSLIPAAALFGAMLFAGVILFVDPPTTLSLKTQPPDAEVRVDGELVSGASPFFVYSLRAGEHVLTVGKEGFVEHRESFHVRDGDDLQLPAVELARAPESLEAAPAAPATGAVSAPEPRAHGGRTTPAAPKPRVARLAPPETHGERAVEPTPAPPRTVAPAPPRPEPEAFPQGGDRGLGMLRINTRPWTKVYIDGRLIGHTPQMGVPLSAGEHRVELVNDELDMRKTIQVKIKPDEIVTKIVNLVE